MPGLRVSHPKRATWCAVTLALAGCSAAGGGGPSYDAPNDPVLPEAVMPGLGTPEAVSPPPSLPPSPPAPVRQGPQTPVTPEDDPAPVGLGPGVAPGAPNPVGPAPTPVPSAPTASDTPELTLGGDCCPDGNCVCHGPEPSRLTDREGPFRVDTIRGSTGTIFHPSDAEPPFAGLAIAAGFLNTGIEILDWGEFFASHGIVTVVTTTTGADLPATRAAKLAASIEELERLNSGSGNPLSGAMSGRYGTSGYSMGGGGTTIASTEDTSLVSSVGLAPWAPVGRGITTPTLLMCGSTDTVAPCSMAEGAFAEIPESTPKMLVVLPLVGHLDWLDGPTEPATGGALALAFQKLFLEGDERWRSVLVAAGGDVTTNISQ
jgi:pimeloyl-ACP methyl ester carboxylesterase